MGFFKILVKIPTLVLITFTIACKPQQETKPQITSDIKQAIKAKDSVYIYPNYLNKDYVLGKFDYKQNSGFQKVPKALSNKEIFIRKETLAAFTKMHQAAKKDTISLKIISGTRNFSHQKGIWDRKWNKNSSLSPLDNAKKILEYSSMPSTSRHHWGTDVDINNLNSSYFKKGQGKKEYDWLVENGAGFGFYQVYTSKENGRTGYNEEEWHWSYVPLSSIFLKYYNTKITLKDISGFKGAKLAQELAIVNNYVNGINPKIISYSN